MKVCVFDPILSINPAAQDMAEAAAFYLRLFFSSQTKNHERTLTEQQDNQDNQDANLMTIIRTKMIVRSSTS